jgi:hypothetical protein
VTEPSRETRRERALRESEEELRSAFKKIRAESSIKREAEAVAALRRELHGGTPKVDGWSGGTSYDGGGGGPTIKVMPSDLAAGDDPVAIEGERIRATGVETSVVARLAGQTNDPHHDLTRNAVRTAVASARQMAGLGSILDQIGKLHDEAPTIPQLCEACAPGGAQHEPEHVGTVSGRLDQVVHLCDSSFQLVQRTGKLPTPDQVRHHERTGRWKITIDPSSVTTVDAGR